ncbi:MAG: hypothetical protein ACYC3I_10085 [Gemmataceae bacterium]
MIGQTVESRPRLPWGAIFWLLLAAALDVLAVVFGNVHWALGSLLPWIVALLLWRIRERSFAARFAETTLEVAEPPLQVPYANLQGLLAPRRPPNPFKAGPRSYAIHVIHTDGVLAIPGRLNVPSDEVYSFLFRQFSSSGSREMHTALADFQRGSERRFGPEQVWTYRARAHLGRNQSYPRLTAFFVALALAAAAWLVWGIVRGSEGWIGGGIFGLLGGGLFALVFWLAGRQRVAGFRRWRQSGLVIAPDGLALAQGDMIGELRWDEVRDVKFGSTNTSFQLTATTTLPMKGIVLKVEGAAIVIADVYDRPLALIYQNIRHYWKGQPRDDWDDDSLPRPSGQRIRPAPSRESLPPSSDGIKPSE